MSNRVELHQQAPDFTLPNFQGQPVRLTDFRSLMHVVLVFNRTFA